MFDEPAQDVNLEEISDEYGAALRRYLERFTGDPETAADLFQETLLRVDRGLPGFEGRSSPKTWVFRIATRVAIDAHRKERVFPEVRAIEMDDDLADDEPAVDERLVFDEMNECIRMEIDALPADYRAAMILHDLEGLTAAETATILGCTLATAKIRIHRARRRLKQYLKRDCEFYRDEDQVLRCDRKGDV
jgi:RNA polymerase sigma-70 factor (ECF subfamily)